MTLEKTWKECLKMWKWIAKKYDERLDKNVFFDVTIVLELKESWLNFFGYNGSLDNDCFFCDYANQPNRGCEYCPGRKIDKYFSCQNSDYDFKEKPVAFYKKLVSLNQKR